MRPKTASLPVRSRVPTDSPNSQGRAVSKPPGRPKLGWVQDSSVVQGQRPAEEEEDSDSEWYWLLHGSDELAQENSAACSAGENASAVESDVLGSEEETATLVEMSPSGPVDERRPKTAGPARTSPISSPEKIYKAPPAKIPTPPGVKAARWGVSAAGRVDSPVSGGTARPSYQGADGRLWCGVCRQQHPSHKPCMKRIAPAEAQSSPPAG